MADGARPGPLGVRTACPYCGVGCGVVATPDGVGGAAIRGDVDHPANAGALCVKGTLLGETLDLDGRLLAPQVDGREVSWPTAIDTVATGFAEAIRTHGPESVAFYVSGQLLTEDYYVANKLMKGFIGAANIDTNSRLCMASSVAGHKRAFGADVVPGLYEDFDHADLVVLVGSNLAWCHPVIARRLSEAKKARPGLRIINVDPRRTATADMADAHVPLAPGSDAALFNGLLARIAARGAVDAAYVAAHTSGLEAALAAASRLSLSDIAAETGLSEPALARFYDQWIDTPRVVTVYSQGVNQSASGVDTVATILNAHLATGRIGRPGVGPFSVTGQPNAMGGREVGGLANMLAAHMDVENAEHRALVRGFWGAPRIAATQGLKAVDLFEALGSGRIKALWIMATNPAVSLPEADAVARAIDEGAFVVVSDIMAETDSTRRARVLLPATGWGEKDGTVTNSERRISRQRPFLAPPGAARHDWRILCDVARALGRRLGEDWDAAFSYASPAEIFREHAALSGIDNRGARAFDISDLAGLSSAQYTALAPTLWPRPSGPGPAGATPDGRFFSKGGFLHADGKARLLPVTPSQRSAARSPAFPIILNTGRVRDHWHTMTRTAKSARLSGHMAEPYAELHPDDAARLGVTPATIVRIESPTGAMLARALITDRQRPGSVFAPMHWTEQTSSLGRVDALVPAVVDPISGQPDSKRAPVRVSAYAAAWHGFAVSRREPTPAAAYWAKARAPGGWRIEMADAAPLADPVAFARTLLGADAAGGAADFAIYEDAARGAWRFALFEGPRALGALFLSPGPVTAARDWLCAALDDGDETATRLDLLAGRPGGDRPDEGALVCVCHSVGAGRIRAAIADGAQDLDAIGARCGAGTNCGSCRPELSALLAETRAAALAAE